AQLVAYRAASLATVAATKIWTGVQWLLNAAMSANPIGIIIVAIVALVAAIVLAYRNSETFRNIVQAVFRAVGAAATWLWENAIKPAWEAIKVAFQVVADSIVWWWNNIARRYFRAGADFAKWLWGRIKATCTRGRGGFDGVGGGG